MGLEVTFGDDEGHGESERYFFGRRLGRCDHVVGRRLGRGGCVTSARVHGSTASGPPYPHARHEVGKGTP
jgi:hypothetical protein